MTRSYRWNYENPPAIQTPPAETCPAIPGEWTLCGKTVNSPLGVAAGPLLNGAWCLYYAALGFDSVTYKTVRTQHRDCYPAPNLTPVVCSTLDGTESETEAATRPQTSWAVSYGMPSQPPDIWQADVRRTRDALEAMAKTEQRPHRPLLSVSVVATVETGATLEELAADYAHCARLAEEAGADCVEANFSCPNVATCDGQLYQQPDQAAMVARRIADALDRAPLIIKVGHLRDEAIAMRVMAGLAESATAVAMTNSVATRVRGIDGELLFDGQSRGICGEACRDASLRQVEMIRCGLDRQRLPLCIIGVGGIFQPRHVRSYLNAGAESVQLATAVMQQPDVALQIRQQW